MKLRQLTNLDTDELVAENAELEEHLAELAILIKNRNARSAFCFKQMDEIAKRHGEARRSQLIAAPAPFTKTQQVGEKPTNTPVRPRFMKVDMVKGIIEQVKGPRGALVVERSEKVIFATQDGYFRKVHSHFKGPISNGFSSIVLAKKETDTANRKFLLVFKLEEALRAFVVNGEDLTKTTSSGKRFLPEGAELIHFGEESYIVQMVSSRKKPLVLDLASTKLGKPNAKGIKVANLNEVCM
jgi:DNA gyrase/topoisomerase IV subunit A